MKISRINMYQAVYLRRKYNHTYFPDKNSPNVTLELIEAVGVKVSEGDTAIIVPFPNISSIELMPEAEEKPSKSKK